MTVAAEPRAAATERTSPYQGLVPYGEADAEWFFGRDDSRDVVLDSLRAYRVSVLYGESGVGKSSLLRASVLAYLRRAAAGNLAAQGRPEILATAFADWSVENPLSALKEAIVRAAAELAPEQSTDPPQGSLAEVLTAWSERVGGDVYIVLDQFEELFLYHGDDQAGGAFEEELVGAIRRRDGAANFVLSIREDALAKLDRLQNRLPGLLDNLVRLEHLDERAAREAIQRPLELWNRLNEEQLSIEPALAEAVVSQLRGGQLLAPRGGGAGRVDGAAREGRIEAPYLQLVLARIWDEERRAGSPVLRVATLERLGGAEHMVRTHLDGVLAGFSGRNRKIAARAFRYLVTPSGTKIAHRPEDLAAYTGVPVERLTPVLTALAGEARIVRPAGDGAYEIYHDVLAAAVLDWRRRYEESRRRGLLGQRVVLSVAAAVVAIMIVAYLGRVLGGLEDRTIDARFSIRGTRIANGIAVVGIDDPTFNHLRIQWPFPRSLHARVIDRLRRDGAKVIAFDIQFTEPTTRSQDEALAKAVARARNVVLATTDVSPSGHTAILGGDENLRTFHARAGNSVLSETSSGVARRVAWGTGSSPAHKLESFGLVAAEVQTGRRSAPSDLGDSTADIDFAGPPGTIPTFSYWKVLRGRFKPGTFRGKIVVVGAQAPALQDVHHTPAGGGLMSGAELHANVVETALRGFPLRPHKPFDLTLVVVLGLLVPAASLRFGWKVNLAIGLVVGGLYVIAAQLAFNHDVRLPVVYPLLALVLTTLFTLSWSLRPRRS